MFCVVKINIRSKQYERYNTNSNSLCITSISYMVNAYANKLYVVQLIKTIR